VQHIFAKVAQSIGGKLTINPRIRTSAANCTNLEIEHTEPGAVLTTQDLSVFIDAKYKSHLLNKSENSDPINDDFQRDLHHVLAYTSFGPAGRRLGVICYPSDQVEVKPSNFRDPLNDTSSKSFIVGIPLKRSVIQDAVAEIAAKIDALRGHAEVE
jgi:hypothetical protein